jgi:hypothetical protein
VRASVNLTFCRHSSPPPVRLPLVSVVGLGRGRGRIALDRKLCAAQSQIHETGRVSHMSKRKKIALVCCGVLVALLAAAAYAVQRNGREHGWWHECRDNCWLIDDAKRICAEKLSLAVRTVVVWPDIQPYLTNSQYWAVQRLSPSEVPTCPAGGTCTVGNIGSWSMCSTPYHQWYNCKSQDQGSAWRN